MRAAATRVRAGEVTRAVRAAESPSGTSRPATGSGCPAAGSSRWAESLSEATCGLLAKLLRDSDEIVTLIEGAGATPPTGAG